MSGLGCRQTWLPPKALPQLGSGGGDPFRVAASHDRVFVGRSSGAGWLREMVETNLIRTGRNNGRS